MQVLQKIYDEQLKVKAKLLIEKKDNLYQEPISNGLMSILKFAGNRKEI